MSVTIKDIRPQVVELVSPDDHFLGWVNEYELNDVRIQIAEQKLEGYYCIFNGIRIDINTDGTIGNWEPGFFDLVEQQLVTLFKLQML